MGYNILITDGTSSDNLLLDRFLGSATSMDFYWETIGRELNLPLIASITERADSEEGFVLFGDNLILFHKEMEVFERYWLKGDSNKSLPDGFLQNIRIIIEGIRSAIDKEFEVVIC